MSYFLVKFNDDWADEMDIDGFHVYDKEVWQRIVTRVKNYGGGFDAHFGTNEENEYMDADDLLSNYKVTEIFEQDYDTLKRLFAKSYDNNLIDYGNFPTPWENWDEEIDE